MKTSTDSLAVENRKKPKKTSIIFDVFSEYCSSTSIHGIGYLGAKDKSLIEKIWWLIVFLISVATCIFLISKTWKKWNDSPVIVSFSQTQTSIWEIPFPAVTICPVNKVQQSVYNYTEEYRYRNNLTGNSHKYFWDISLICNLQWITEFNVSNTTDEAVIDNILKVAPALDDTIPYVVWQNKEIYDTENLFAPQLTEEGLCFTFNSLGQKDMFTDYLKHDVTFIGHNKPSEGWSIEDGYPEHSSMKTYPERTAQDGLIGGIRISLFSLRYEKDYVCGIPISGFKVLLHNPAEPPKVSQQYILAPLKKLSTIAVKPNMITTSRGLISIPPHMRKCYFSHEKSLQFFKIYTQTNCKTECVANVTKAHCGCLPFFMPRDNNTTICAYGKMSCLEDIQSKILEYEMMFRKNRVPESEKNKIEYQIFSHCDCQPSCAAIEYRGETSQADLHWVKSIKALEYFDNLTGGSYQRWLDGLEVTQVDIFFKETQFLALHRSELYGQTDFLANCGGLLGLFMGFSFLSLLEIIYFVTLRIWCHKKNKKEQDNIETKDN